MNYASFKTEWNGRAVDFDHVYAYQCVDLILEYLYELTGSTAGVWGNAIDYANRPTPSFLAKVDKVTDGSKQPGDIIVLTGLAGNPYGHIAIRDTNVDAMLEQNGATGGGTGTGRDAIGVYRGIPYNRVAAVYRLKVASPPPAPAPLPGGNSHTVYLPSSTGSWHLYRIGSQLRPNTSDVIAILRPDLYPGNTPPGLTYKIESWIGDYAVVVTTQMFGRGVLYVKNDGAVIS